MATRYDEPVNAPASGFNEPRRLFGIDQTDMDAAPRKVVRRISDPRDSRAIKESDGRVKVQLGATPEDTIGATVTQAVVETIDREVMTGNFSMVRAARILHQYDVDFWKATGVVGPTSRSSQPAPSEDELAEKYNDFLAFSYMPGPMLPSQSEFRDLANPQARESYVLAHLQSAGVVADSRASGLINESGQGGPETLADVPPPFAENLQSSCSGQEYFARSTGPLYTANRDIA